MTSRLKLISRPTGEDDDEVIVCAVGILRARFKERDVFAKPDAVKDYLRLQAQGLTHEVFALMYLDAQNRLIEYEPIFRGTLTQTSVYPREIVKRALAVNAASVILHHSVARHKMMLMYPDPLCSDEASAPDSTGHHARLWPHKDAPCPNVRPVPGS